MQRLLLSHFLWYLIKTFNNHSWRLKHEIQTQRRKYKWTNFSPLVKIKLSIPSQTFNSCNCLKANKATTTLSLCNYLDFKLQSLIFPKLPNSINMLMITMHTIHSRYYNPHLKYISNVKSMNFSLISDTDKT